jgi:general secretion pathway protein H
VATLILTGKRRRAARHTGFTLLELLVVLVLFGLLISIVTISVAPDPRQDLSREAQRVGQLMSIAADESRIRQQPIVWEADLKGYRFVSEAGGERKLIVGDDLLRERDWSRPLARIAIFDPGVITAPSQILLSQGAPAVRRAVAREWIQPRWRLEMQNDIAKVEIDFDENGRGYVAAR